MRHKTCPSPSRKLSLKYETRKRNSKENGLTNIDELMDVQFGKLGTPEREKFREEARTYVTDIPKLRNVGTPKRYENNRLFLSVPASRRTLSP